MLFKNQKSMMMKTTSGANALARSSMSPAERAMGRFMRAPDEHGGGDPPSAADPAAADAAPAADGGDAAAPAAADEQVTTSPDKAAEAAEGKDGEGDDGTSIAGGAGADKDGEGEGDAKSAIIGAPEGDYEIKVPEELAAKGMTFDKEVFDLVAPDLKEMDLSNNAAQKLANVYAEKVIPALLARGEKNAKEAQDQHAAQIRKEWADASRSDPEIGGANFDQTVDACAAVWDKFGIKKGEGFRLLLDESGIGNHPDFLRFLSRVSKATGEGQFVSPDGAGTDTRPIWDRVYGQPEPAKTG